MIRAHLDSVTTTRFFEGWAFDPDHPCNPIDIAVLRDGVELAAGLAHRYREDLAEAACGTGWCAFRLRFDGSPKQVSKGTITLIERGSGTELFRTGEVRVIDDSEIAIASFDDLLESDPTSITEIEQLRGCGPVFASFIERHGIPVFLRALYVYLFSRPADIEGIALYDRCLRQGTLTPLGVVDALSKSEEFRGRLRLVKAPWVAGFPFGE